jgi:nanoRNase/pAp phosphatase (c-di-AMP/oligoRNAs hydrolase)
MSDDVVKALKNRNKVILVHGNADMDAMGCAYAISECFRHEDSGAY